MYYEAHQIDPNQITAHARSAAATATEKAEALAQARWMQSLVIAKGDAHHARTIYANKWPRSRYLSDMEQRSADGRLTKAAVSAMTTPDAESILSDDRLQRAWLQAVQPRTVLGRMTNVRQVPIRLRVPRETDAAQLQWFGQGQPIPATKLNLDQLTLEPLKIGGIAAISTELARSSDPVAQMVVQSSFQNSAISGTDRAFLDPNLAAVPDVSPASITNGAPSFAVATATDDDAIQSEMLKMFDAITTDFIAPYIICTPKVAIRLSRVTDANGSKSYPFITVTGGRLQGIPVITSGSAPAGAVILIDAATLAYGDDGIEFDASQNAAVALDDTGTGQLVSLWQSNFTGYRLIRRINWTATQTGGVALVTGLV